MSLFVDYIQPLTQWLRANPSWALIITFLIALSESLAIVGSIVPGSVTMTAIGILAGSGIMRIDLTLLFATLGAISGDSLSYFIGYFYSDRLVEMWPFKKYPGLMKYGEDFFERHGGKSVLIGRFVGPLRSIIPVIAGIMHMKQWRFLIANSISGIGWSLLYVMPGILVGAAGHELSTEVATQLFVFILLLLVGIWLISTVLKWVFINLQHFLRNNLHDLWLQFTSLPILSNTFRFFTPDHETNHYTTVGLFCLALISLFLFIFCTVFNFNGLIHTYVDLPIFYFIQSIHSSLLEAFFIICLQFTSPITITLLFIVYTIWFVYHKDYKAITTLTSLVLLSLLLGIVLNVIIQSPRPEGILVVLPGNSYPSLLLLISTALYGFILFHINAHYSLITGTLRTIVLIVLGLSGFAEIYLGDSWLSDIIASFFLGTFLCLIYCLRYRKHRPIQYKSEHAWTMVITFILTICIATLSSTAFKFKTSVHNHMPYQKEYKLTHIQWWNQNKPVLPIYRLNRVGKRISLLNIQYAGDLETLATHLKKFGWKKQEDKGFFSKLISNMNKNSEDVKLPLLNQLFENKRPELIMTFKDQRLHLILELTIWESNYHLAGYDNAIWIGAVHQNAHNLKKKKQAYFISDLNPLSYVAPALNEFKTKKIKLPSQLIKTATFQTLPYILLIEKDSTLP